MPCGGGPKIPLNSPYYPKEKKPPRIRATAISYREKVVRIVGRYGKDYSEIEKYFLERHMKRHTIILSPDSSYYPYMILEDKRNMVGVTIVYQDGKRENLPYLKIL